MQLDKWAKSSPSFLALSSLLAIVITVFLYGRAVSIPFYSDDLLQIPWARTAPMDEIWGTLNPFSHFRPVQFSLWRVWQWVAGDLTPGPLRLFNLLLHAGSGSLTGFLAFRFTHRDWFAGIGSTLLFVLFPFSYDAILWVSSAAYPLAVFLGLLSVHSWLNADRVENKKGWGWFFVALACALASALSLESGILVGLILVLTDVLILQRFSWPRIGTALSVSVIPFLIINFLTPSPAVPFDLERLVQNGAMMAQATTYPFSYGFARFLDGFDPVKILWLAGLLFFAAVGLIGYRSKKLALPLTFAWVWIVLWGVIPAVTQTYIWDRDPPRAFYPCAVGIALVWGLLLTTETGQSPLKKATYRIILSIALLVPLGFNNQISRYYQQAGRVLQQVLDVATNGDQPASNLFVNLPERIGPQEKTWLLGYEGVIPMPPPTDTVSLFLAVNGASTQSAENKIFGTILASSDVHEIGLAGTPFTLNDLTAPVPLKVYAAEYSADNIQLAYLGQLNSDLSPADFAPADFIFEERMALSLVNCSLNEDGAVQATLAWALIGERLDPNRSIFVHLWENEEIVDQADGQFLTGLFPIHEFSSESQQLVEQRVLKAQGIPPYKVGIGLYNPADGKRSLAKDFLGNPVENNYILLDCDD